MEEQFIRTARLIGGEAVEKLAKSKVLLFGVGGVGSFAAEALARAGVGEITLVDGDTVALSNLNRQLLATHSTIGLYKVDVAQERIRDIDPTIEVRTYKTFFLPETAAQFDFSQYDYVLDAIDTVTGKLALIAQAKAAGTKIISCMGTGNKLDPTAFEVTDISKTSGCTLARIMRKECAKRGLKGVKVVFSKELAMEPTPDPSETPDPQREGSSRRSIPGSIAFVPAVAGLIMAGEVIKELAQVK